MAGLTCVSSFAVIVLVSAVILWQAWSSWSFTEEWTALNCCVLTVVLACTYRKSIHGVAVTPSSCLSISGSNFFAFPDITMRLMTSHMLSSVPGFTTFPPPPPDSVLENHWQMYSKFHICRSCKYAGVSGVSLLGSLPDPAGIVLWEQTGRGSLWHINRSP